MTADGDVCIMSVWMRRTGDTESARAMVVAAMKALQREEDQQSVSDCLYAETISEMLSGRPLDGQRRLDLNYYDFTLNEENHILHL